MSFLEPIDTLPSLTAHSKSYKESHIGFEQLEDE